MMCTPRINQLPHFIHLFYYYYFFFYTVTLIITLIINIIHVFLLLLLLLWELGEIDFFLGFKIDICYFTFTRCRGDLKNRFNFVFKNKKEIDIIFVTSLLLL